MTSQFPPSEFDEWAASYDTAARQESGFPFEGYSKVLEIIVKLSAPQAGESVLDLGIGTGNLALLFTAKGCDIWGIDFSVEMLALAKVKLPGAVLTCQDLRKTLPPDFEHRFHHIVSAYTFHHFPLDEKVSLIRGLQENVLRLSGNIVIGDIAFQDAAAEEHLRRQLGEEWEQEFYWLVDDALAALTAAGINAAYTQVSSCAGIFAIK